MSFIKTHAATILISIAVIITGYILGNSYLSKGKADPKITNDILLEKLNQS